MSYSSDRRAMLLTSAAGLAALAVDAEAGGETPTPIIDTHQHLWDFRLFRPPWLNGEPKLNKSTTMDDYLKATKGLNVRKTIYMEVDVAPRDQKREADWVASVCASKQTPMVAGVVSCRPGTPGFAAYLEHVRQSPYLRGMRQVLQVPEAPRGFCLQPAYVRDVKLMGKNHLTFDICIRPTELADAAKLVDACPETRFILDHCGNGAARNPNQQQWEGDIIEISKRPNIVCKISGIIKTSKQEWNPVTELAPVVNHCIDCFGIDRVMFGGDWPVCNNTSSFAGWVRCLKAIVHGSSDADQGKLFYSNAAAFYRV